VLPLALAVLAAGAACIAWGIVVERRWYRVRRYDLAILPTAGGPDRLSILHLSDLHFLRRDATKASFLNHLPRADLTIATGDFLAEPDSVETAVESIRTCRGRLGSWYVLGSNDYFSPQPLNYLAYLRPERKRRRGVRGRPDDLRRLLADDGWLDLTNSRRTIDVDGLAVEVLGLDDAHIRWHDLRRAPRVEPDRFGVAVMHSPDTAPEAAAFGYDLVLAGHTHGGQVCLPGFGAIVTNCSMPRRLAAGLFRMGPAILHTSRGLGTSKYAPFRFACRPEVTFLELTRRPAAS
jgi:predicted MPP superfamily phosphohydrolase